MTTEDRLSPFKVFNGEKHVMFYSPLEEEETEKNKTSANRTNVRKALRLALSSPIEVIAMLKGLKNTRTK